MSKWWVHFLVVLLLIPLTIWLGVTLFEDRRYVFISFTIILLALLPFLFSFEKKKVNLRYMVIIAALVTLSVLGRFLFAAIPAFKPVTAIVVLAAIFFGSEAGFLVGALSAIISNIYFGQGPWTPFQMFSWGMIGFIAGLPKLRQLLMTNRIVLIIYGVFSGMIYSLIMDVWTVISIDSIFNWKRYVAAITLAIPFTITYAISNVVFLLITIKIIGNKLERIKMKYGI